MTFNTPATSSGLLAADTAVRTQPSRLLGVSLIGDGTNACNVIIYDNASAASGTVLAKLSLPASGFPYIDMSAMAAGIVANNGLFADVTGTGAAFIIYYAAE